MRKAKTKTNLIKIKTKIKINKQKREKKEEEKIKIITKNPTKTLSKSNWSLEHMHDLNSIFDFDPSSKSAYMHAHTFTYKPMAIYMYSLVCLLFCLQATRHRQCASFPIREVTCSYSTHFGYVFFSSSSVFFPLMITLISLFLYNKTPLDMGAASLFYLSLPIYPF